MSAAQAFMVATAGRLGLASAATGCTAARVEECPCMGCRTNLKKEKRVRNRINAFRFKKGGFVRRRFGPDYAAEQAKADADNQFYSMVFTYSAEAAALAEEEAKKEAKKEAVAA